MSKAETISIPSLALNYVDNRLESIGYGGELYHRERTLRAIDSEMMRSGGVKSRYEKLFGTPERAAVTLLDVCDNCGQNDCSGCQLYEFTSGGDLDYDALLEWLRGDA